MRLVTYEIEHREGLGVMSRDGKWIFPLRSMDMDYKTMQQLIENISESEKQLLEYMSSQNPYKIRGAAPIEEVKLLAPIPHPRQDVICLGINYMDHAEESARFKKEEFNGERPYAVYFSKRVNQAVNPGDGIPSHSDIVKDLDYEAEMAVIIGKEASHVPENQVKDYIFGYTIINDVSARTIQNRHKQWYFGKSLDGFLPMGPCIATVDELEFPPKVQVQSRVNGELRQNENTSRLLFGVAYIVSELSQGMTLKPGTIIATGTPAGVGMGFNPPKFLKPGDVVECSVEGIGSITNPVV
ncbi:MAG TPA: fumarylacetoacetate hydrolase family protein [Candidatus Enterocloster excrementipullorum]|uniref:Fumarylacetoacetate hydrolase family protein n=1 Tax=Candidatus Enterocloster excrementipullorum TaxID=2838559 RepID=A0A9D2SJ36_9FIRM|nr:fumarylacetoacetate hydrolase family protein [Candidatus Enterocloster excrementipullorum]